MDLLKTDLKQFKKRCLFRVQYPGTRTRFTPGVGLEAQDTVTSYNNKQIHEGPNGGLLSAITKHLNWNRTYGSSFITLFGSKQHAKNWAMKRCLANGKECQVLTIDVNKLGKSAYVFDAGQIANMSTLDMYRSALRSINDEFLVAWRVSEDAIVRTEIVRHPNHGLRNCCEIPLGSLSDGKLELVGVDERDKLVDQLEAVDIVRLFGDL